TRPIIIACSMQGSNNFVKSMVNRYLFVIIHMSMSTKCIFLFFLTAAILGAAPACASYLPTTGSNIGIGTNTPQAGFVVTNGNVGIGTWTAAGGNLIVNGGGNVGIGSAWPGAALDVQGNIRVSGSISGSLGSTTIGDSGNLGVGTT